MNDAALTVRQVGYEQRMYWRNPGAFIFTFVFPIVFLVIFAAVFEGRIEFLGDIAAIQYYVPGIVVFGVISACFTGLSITLTLRREEGVLKRKRATPLPAAALIGGIVGNAIVIAVIEVVILVAVGVVGYDLDVRASRLPTLAVVVAAGAVTFCILGVAISSLTPNADAAPAIANVVIFPMLFLSGTFFPIESDTLNRIAGVLPVRPFVDATFAVFDPRGSGVSGADLAALGAWALVGLAVSIRLFRWEPRPT